MISTRRKFRETLGIILTLLILPALVSVSCVTSLPGTPGTQPSPETPTATTPTLSPPPKTEITFRVEIPANSPPSQPVSLNILDEVTGLALNAKSYPMHMEDDRHFTLQLFFAVGTVIKYRYTRQGDAAPVNEHTSDGRPVRYRLYHVEGPSLVDDVVSRWTDTPFEGPTGRIRGTALDAASGQPIPGLLVTAGGAQTLTAADGTFLLEGLPPGTHNLVAYALDGSYRPFQQGAIVAEGSTTPANISLTAAPMVNVIFVVSLPANTVPAVPIRMAGNLYQLGNTFADLSGGVSTLASRMPVLTVLPDHRYSLTLTLPAGADVRYLYTLGDGFWNTELDSAGNPPIRQIIVPETNTVIQDKVESWGTSSSAPITFDVTVPEDTPPEDYISIQFNPFFGWTAPIPMWRLSPTRWAYVLSSPLDRLSSFNYRYCRNDQCGSADDAETMGENNVGFPIHTALLPQTIVDQVTNWAWMETAHVQLPEGNPPITARGQNFLAGTEFQAYYNPSWLPLLGHTLDDVQKMFGNWLVLDPTWSYTRNDPPVLEIVSGRDPLWPDLAQEVAQTKARGLNVALNPTPVFPGDPADWWAQAPRTFSWWLVWFDGYRNFALHHAGLAAATGAQALILGGDWIAPALPGGTLSDGSPSGVPADALSRWRELIQEVRSRYSGPILWALPYDQAVNNPPAFLDSVDGVYVLWSVPLTDKAAPTETELETEAGRLLDNGILLLRERFKKPVFLGVAYPSAMGAGTNCLPNPGGGCLSLAALARPNPDIPGLQIDLNLQAELYDAMLSAVNQRDWISGIVARGYYPPAILRDKSASVHGKPAQDVLSYWYPRLLGNPAP